MDEAKCSVSVLVATYNSNKAELYLTLNSIVLQKNVSLEIIIADDGSKVSLASEIDEFFNRLNFIDYKLINNTKNEGTVINIYTGAIRCCGKYTKMISPGDMFADENVLHDWVEFLEKTDCDISFGNPVYYTNESEHVITYKHYAWPQNVRLFESNDKRLIRENYLLANDTIHGVSTIIKTDVLQLYIKKIVGKVIYAEDSGYRLMINDGIQCNFFDRSVVLYKCNTGISNSSNSIWTERLKNDIRETDKILVKSINNKKFRRKFLSSIKYRENKTFLSLIVFLTNNPKVLLWKLKAKLYTRYTPTDYDHDFYNKCIEI